MFRDYFACMLLFLKDLFDSRSLVCVLIHTVSWHLLNLVKGTFKARFKNGFNGAC